jgi:hypothetical protein
MGLIRKLAQRLRDGVREGVRSAKEEAVSPGRPPPHRESINPFWEEERRKGASAPVSAQAGAPVAAPAAPAAPESSATAATSGRPWYLEGEAADEGWDETNPGWEPGRKWEGGT